MGSSKALLALVLFMATIILISSEVAPKDKNLDTDDGKLDTNGIGEGKYRRGGYYGGPWRGHGPWRGGYGGYCRYGCCGWGYNGRCVRCCYYRGEHVQADVNVEPYN